MFLFVTAVKLLAEIALMALLGQWLLGKLAGARREQNLIYQLLGIVARPAVALARGVPVVAFLLLTVVWLAATLTKIRMCVEIGVALCR